MKDKWIKLSNEYKLRSSQAITPFGMGSIVDFKRQSLMAASTEFWDISKCREIHDERLERVLNVDTFYLPFAMDKDKELGFPFTNFPEWYFCPNCRVFKSLKEWEKDFLDNHRNKDKDVMKEPVCLSCRNVRLVPARIVCICNNGHIQDFPWIAWTHYKSRNRTDKMKCDNPKLKISTIGSTTGLEGIRIECTHCKASASLQGSFTKGGFKEIIERNNNDWPKLADEFRCIGNKPWSLTTEKCDCDDELVVVQRGASNVHYTKIISSIVIPPYSNKLSYDIENHESYKEIIRDIAELDEDETNEDYLEDRRTLKKIRRIAKEIRFDLEEVKKVIFRKLLKGDGHVYNELAYKTEEYKALTGQVKIENQKSIDFKLKNTNIKDYRIDYLSKVVLVEKLREVRALVGFTRILPPDNKHFNADDELRESKLVSAKYENWYPAFEVRGEGIFIEIDYDHLEEWAKNNKVLTRIQGINYRNKQILIDRGNEEREITPEFMVLHTLAHLIIKQLSFECGYSSASLRERIYFNNEDGPTKMSGILIYTASGDAEGTLGGLTRQGYPDKLPQIIIKALTNAMWCSNDPVCIESKGQGRNSLNLASCYSCSLISETSCEEFNVLLDRAMLIGTLEEPDIGFFSKMMSQIK